VRHGGGAVRGMCEGEGEGERCLEKMAVQCGRVGGFYVMLR
jgi:hypothetical protein